MITQYDNYHHYQINIVFKKFSSGKKNKDYDAKKTQKNINMKFELS